MAKYRATCPGCNEKFVVELSSVPRFCPMCGFDTADDVEAEQARLEKMLATQSPPHYAHKTIRKVVDNMADGIFAASEARVEAAAEMAGVDRSEMAALKITDMKDNLREGDTAHVPVDNLVSRAISAAGDSAGNTRNEPVINWARTGTTQGALPRTGLGMMHAAQQRTFNRTPEHIPATKV